MRQEMALQQRETMKFEDGEDQGCTSEDSLGGQSVERERFRESKVTNVQRSSTVEQQNRTSAQMMQDRTFKIDSPLKITQVAMLSPLSKTQNSFMKPNEDQEIQKGFTFQSKTRPPTLGKDGQRPILQN